MLSCREAAESDVVMTVEDRRIRGVTAAVVIGLPRDVDDVVAVVELAALPLVTVVVAFADFGAPDAVVVVVVITLAA